MLRRDAYPGLLVLGGGKARHLCNAGVTDEISDPGQEKRISRAAVRHQLRDGLSENLVFRSTAETVLRLLIEDPFRLLGPAWLAKAGAETADAASGLRALGADGADVVEGGGILDGRDLSGVALLG